ncbi:hypothetical protein [Leptospira adleri]|uniref:Uncharacterized protein n=1 Tax=Leptospira adleri TaxID=2023186 RepID=A0A2M9YTN3_9LEPT|nr:hypothetical protein [Leptospira adleri]PJZ54893.1 hypothetical protein CH380_04070 [Leptospira adleri]PJZ60879.1 hypothetical protein CH376_16300 [Leptospira adleri]TGM57953.1 hypothetical protein EHQ97_09740 [Leptospira adleri]
MVFHLLAILFLILRSYSFLSPGAVVLAFAILFYRKKGGGGSRKNHEYLEVLILLLLAISGLDGSTAGDILDLICIHCAGILALKKEETMKRIGEIRSFAPDSDSNRILRKQILPLSLLLISIFRIWYQGDFEFWNSLTFFYILKTGILSFALTFLYFRSGESGKKTVLFLFLILTILIVHPSQGILNFSYFLIFSFLQTDAESKKINDGIEV